MVAIDWSEHLKFWVKCEHCGEFTEVRWLPWLERERERRRKQRETLERKRLERAAR